MPRRRSPLPPPPPPYLLPPPPYTPSSPEKTSVPPASSVTSQQRSSRSSRYNLVTPGIHRLSLQGARQPPYQRMARSTRTVNPPTWGQLKALSERADSICRQQNIKRNSVNMFIAMLAVLSIQVLNVEATGQNKSYWAYIPNPPLVKPVTWKGDDIPVFNNHTKFLGESCSSFIMHKTDSNFSFHGKTDKVPICFMFNNTHKISGCFSTTLKTILTDSPKSNKPGHPTRDLWSLTILMPGGPDTHEYNPVTLPPKGFHPCKLYPPKKATQEPYWWSVKNRFGFPPWQECAYYNYINYTTYAVNFTIQDWSSPYFEYNYRKLVQEMRDNYSWSNKYNPLNKIVTRWQSAG
ncbi:uncharacterized protein [Saccopteryx bilineata]|uniref:uncharacterized protein n=1 Tax=Saccopteryx bilineata TaxID=59482 RepID=UPI00338E4A8F